MPSPHRLRRIRLRINDDSGRSLRSELDVEATEDGFDIVLHSNGGASRGAPRQNPDYIEALETLFARLRSLNASLDGIWVDSKVVAHLPVEQRAVRPGRRSFPISMRDVSDIRALRLEIRRSVSRIGGKTAGSIGTGNKRIRLSVSSVRTSLRAFERAIAGTGAMATGYWLSKASSTPDGEQQRIAVPAWISVASGHLVVRATAGKSSSSTAAIDVWYVGEVSIQSQSEDHDRSHDSTAWLIRLSPELLVGFERLTSIENPASANSTAEWIAIDESAFRSILDGIGISADDLVFPLPGWGDIKTRRRASAVLQVGASMVRERISRYVERGPVGDLVKAANRYHCQICVELGLSGLGFPRIGDVPFVEAHHVVPVSSLEEDVLGPSNVIAVCPNHHRQLHFGGVVATDEGDSFRFDFPFGIRAFGFGNRPSDSSKQPLAGVQARRAMSPDSRPTSHHIPKSRSRATPSSQGCREP